MTYYKFLQTIQIIANTHPLINEFGEGDVYEYMNSGSHKYPCLFLTLTNITTDDDGTTYNFTLFYIDRLLDNNINKVNVQSTGVNVIKQVLNKMTESLYEVQINSLDFTPFTEKFADYCGGAFANVSINDALDIMNDECDNIEFNAKTITILNNGVFNVLGYDQALVEVPVPDTDEYEQIITDLTNQITKLEDQNELVEEQRDVLQAEVDQLLDENAVLEEENTGLQNRIDSLTSVTFDGNGTFEPTEDILGWNEVIVDVPSVTTLEVTQEQYDALTTYDQYTIYLITE